MKQSSYFHAQQALLDNLEVTLRNRMAREINRYLGAYARSYMAGENELLPFLVFKHEENVQILIEQNIRKTAHRFGKLVYRQIQIEAKKLEVSFFDRLINEWLLTEGLKNAKSISSTTAANIAVVLAEARTKTISVASIAASIRGISKMTPNRASMIARTETHNAAMFASERSAVAAQDEFGYEMQKRWIPAEDSRTRPTHAAMIGSKPIDMDQRFNVGGEMMMRPGDPKASAKNVIRCRCVLAYTPKDFEIE